MTGNQTTILWLGIILIALNLIVNLAGFKDVIFNETTGSTTPGGNSSSPPGGNPPLAPGQSQTPPSVMV